MDEKKIIYEMVLDIWNLAKKYEFKNLTDEQWEEFINSGEELRKKFMKQGKNIESLCRGFFSALQNYYKGLNK